MLLLGREVSMYRVLTDHDMIKARFHPRRGVSCKLCDKLDTRYFKCLKSARVCGASGILFNFFIGDGPVWLCRVLCILRAHKGFLGLDELTEDMMRGIFLWERFCPNTVNKIICSDRVQWFSLKIGAKTCYRWIVEVYTLMSLRKLN